jgi:leucyl aminopeptidase
MPLAAQFADLAEVHADWMILFTWENGERECTPGLGRSALGDTVARLKKSGDIKGKANELTSLLEVHGIAASRVMVVGLGKPESIDRAAVTDAAAAAARAITTKEYDRVALVLPVGAPGLDWTTVATAAGVGILQGSHGPGLRKSETARFEPREIAIVAPVDAPAEAVRAGARLADVQGRAIALARDLVNTPPCDLYPESFADRARQEASRLGIDCEILDEKRLESERMGALLGVARGSDRPPRVVVLRYRPRSGAPTLGLVGKGVTFDSGGLSLKSTDSMVDMKCDMAGAATVLASTLAAAELQVPTNMLSVLALVENMPSGRSLKLGDVLHTRAGKTIEVLNTDAEGRLILADALTYAVDNGVSHLVDVATLTGACVVALGTEVAGVMTNDDAWSERVLDAARQAGEKAWPLPMFSHYDEMIKSHVADFKNTGGSRWGGAITAAKLLAQFVGKVPWAHLDIAGPAWVERESASRDPGATGCFVRTLVELARAYPPGAHASGS